MAFFILKYLYITHMIYLKTFEENIKNENDIDSIVDSYLQTALWTDEELDGRGIYDFSDEIRKNAKAEVLWFVVTAGEILDELDNEQIGHDIWLTRNRHGTGFWDRGLDDDVSNKLVKLCEELGEVWLTSGEEDGEGDLYMDGGNTEIQKLDIDKYIEELPYKREIDRYNI